MTVSSTLGDPPPSFVTYWHAARRTHSCGQNCVGLCFVRYVRVRTAVMAHRRAVLCCAMCVRLHDQKPQPHCCGGMGCVELERPWHSPFLAEVVLAAALFNTLPSFVVQGHCPSFWGRCSAMHVVRRSSPKGVSHWCNCHIWKSIRTILGRMFRGLQGWG